MVEVDKSIGRPDLLAQFLARYEIAGVLQQGGQHLNGLTLHTQLDPALAQFTDTDIEFERVKS